MEKEAKSCTNCAKLVSKNGEMCRVKKQRLEELFTKIDPDGNNFATIFTGMMEMDAPCPDYQRNPDTGTDLRNNLEYLKQLSRLTGCDSPKIDNVSFPAVNTRMVPAVKIDNISININVDIVKKDNE
jgi:hypothetical protein